MAISRFKTSSVAQGLPKFQDFWDQTTVGFGPQGIIAGGDTGVGGVNIATIQKFLFATEARTTLSATIGTARNEGASMSRQGVGGYFAGGSNSSGYFNLITKFLMGADTASTISATLSRNKFTDGTDNTTIAGYTIGGYESGGSTSLSEVDKLTYSTETKSTLSATYQIRGSSGNLKNWNTAGYYCGGYTGSAYDNVIKKLSFSTETFSTATGLSSSRIVSAGTNNYTTCGYIWGGTTANYDMIQKLVYATDTPSTLAATMASGGSAYQNSGLDNGTVSGYHPGAYPPAGGGPQLSIQKLTYSTEARTTIGATLSISGNGQMGISYSGN